MPLLEIEGLTRRFGGLAAVAGVDFHVDRGEIVGVIGPNGAGKTTMFNLISGGYSPTAGTIRFKGENISGLKPHQICKLGVARTFQSVRIFANMTVLENVLLGSLFGMSAKSHMPDAMAQARHLLKSVELSDKERNLARDLSVANQKRIELARALATNPELVLLDEIIAGLNPAEIIQFMELIKGIREQGITVVMIEHVMKVIMEISDRIVVLHHGEKIAEGAPTEIAKSQKVIEVYLGK